MIDYISSKHLEPFAIGLMKGSAKIFTEKLIITQEKVEDVTRFTLELEK